MYDVETLLLIQKMKLICTYDKKKWTITKVETPLDLLYSNSGIAWVYITEQKEKTTIIVEGEKLKTLKCRAVETLRATKLYKLIQKSA